MPRPRKDDDHRKTVHMTVRMTQAEASTIHTAADAAGITVSDLLRCSALRLPLPKCSRRRPVQNADELAAVLRGLGRIGGNVNQLAKVANAGSWPGSEAIDQARSDIHRMRDALMNALGTTPESSRP